MPSTRTKTPITIRLISDFNIEVFGRYLDNDEQAPACVAAPAAFGQVFQLLSSSQPGEHDAAVVWTRPESVVPPFGRALEFEVVATDLVLAAIDEFATALVRYAGTVRFVFVPTWSMPVGHRGYGMLDWRAGLGLSHLLAQMNLRLADRLASTSNIFLLGSEPWMRAAGARAGSPKLWYASKNPFGNAVYQAAVLDVRAAVRGLLGEARKVIVLDLDNTLWGGVVGELGWQGINLGGHDIAGESFVDFQRHLKALARRGIQLCIASKNDEAPALEAIDRHPEMLLRRSDLAAWRINWNDKAQSIAELLEELNLGVSSAVFIDDSAIERARVREVLPAVLVPEWPEDPAMFVGTLCNLRCFDSPAVSEEDRRRGELYAAERERRATLAAVGSPEEWLATLDIRVQCEELRPANAPRAAQLFNKTNQLNLTTRRFSESELLDWAAGDNRKLWTFRVSDRFGDSGLTGIVSVEITDRAAVITDFILSCRVMGRMVEETLVHVASEFARSRGATEIRADFRPTERNAPCLEFWRRSGFEEVSEHRFRRSAAVPYPLPTCVSLTRDTASDS